MAEFSGKNTTIAQGDLTNEVPATYNGDVEVTYTSAATDKWSYNAKLKTQEDGTFAIDGDLSNYTNKGSNTHIFAQHVEAGTYRDEFGTGKENNVGGFFDGRNSTTFGKTTAQGNFTYNGGASSAAQGSMSVPAYIDADENKETRQTKITSIYQIGDYNVLGARNQ